MVAKSGCVLGTLTRLMVMLAIHIGQREVPPLSEKVNVFSK